MFRVSRNGVDRGTTEAEFMRSAMLASRPVLPSAWAIEARPQAVEGVSRSDTREFAKGSFRPAGTV
jgi:hypothetical protein